jgi:hypothetical protein
MDTKHAFMEIFIEDLHAFVSDIYSYTPEQLQNIIKLDDLFDMGKHSFALILSHALESQSSLDLPTYEITEEQEEEYYIRLDDIKNYTKKLIVEAARIVHGSEYYGVVLRILILLTLFAYYFKSINHIHTSLTLCNIFCKVLKGNIVLLHKNKIKEYMDLLYFLFVFVLDIKENVYARYNYYTLSMKPKLSKFPHKLWINSTREPGNIGELYSSYLHVSGNPRINADYILDIELIESQLILLALLREVASSSTSNYFDRIIVDDKLKDLNTTLLFFSRILKKKGLLYINSSLNIPRKQQNFKYINNQYFNDTEYNVFEHI